MSSTKTGSSARCAVVLWFGFLFGLQAAMDEKIKDPRQGPLSNGGNEAKATAQRDRNSRRLQYGGMAVTDGTDPNEWRTES